ncbi:hypothetical protein, partial [Schinkia azotoformans]|uniref:hypothetical protein n=1 Tax=Schinkia azotoformans TaxID=1454 RepID=UPI002DBD0B41
NGQKKKNEQHKSVRFSVKTIEPLGLHFCIALSCFMVKGNYSIARLSFFHTYSFSPCEDCRILLTQDFTQTHKNALFSSVLFYPELQTKLIIN